jgi:hypothetical protein
LRADTDPVGLITTRNIHEGEILTSTALTKENDYFDVEEVSISIRASDIPGNTDVGDLVTIYQVGDSRNGETIEAPIRILSGVFVSALERKGSNFGSELSITLAISHEYVPRVLSATDRGRIVIVGSHGR